MLALKTPGPEFHSNKLHKKERKEGEKERERGREKGGRKRIQLYQV